ncbi:MAG: hypothetical protein IPO87_10665 [Flavobacteriales bacterium]|nr:hypothetical protein [Flavobacteriales bacterium]
MTLEASEFDTRIATLVRVSNELLEIRYKPGTVFITEDVAEVQSMPHHHGQRALCPLHDQPEDTDFGMESMRTDHAEPTAASQIIATAIVAKSTLIERLTNVYLKFFPSSSACWLRTTRPRRVDGATAEGASRARELIGWSIGADIGGS